MDLLTNEAFLKAFAAANIIWLGCFAGVALGLYIFSIPIIKQSSSTLLMVQQFCYLIKLGFRYMQGGSRIQAVPHVALIYLFYSHPDPRVAGRWVYLAASIFIGLQSAWYEKIFIFPTNDRLIEMESELKDIDEDQDRKARAEVLRLLEKWRFWHIGRIVLPTTSFALAVCGLLY